MKNSEKLEAQLNQQPFDLSLRSQYAQALNDEGRLEDALRQWDLVISQSKSAEPKLQKALCLTQDSRSDEALEIVEQARDADDFDTSWRELSAEQHVVLTPQPRMSSGRLDAASSQSDSSSSLPSAAAPSSAPALRVISGGASEQEGQVVSIHRGEKIRFKDVAGMDALKKTLRLRIIEPFIRPSLFQKFKRRAGGGVLLFGPPGCGKTMMAKAIATECEASFTAIGISDVLSMWIGESERNLAEIFDKAREERPAVLFFDELDALAFSRSKANSDTTRSMVNEFLNQLDGVSHQNEGVLVLGATNLPWDVDAAMKRPGRFDRQIFVPPPDEGARLAMFEMKLLDVPTSLLRTKALALATTGFSGADIDGAIELAKDAALLREIDGETDTKLTQEDLLGAIHELDSSTGDWLKSARNLVKFGGGGPAYKDVEKYLRKVGMY